MMKLNQITLRYLKGQKKHTVMTVIAAAISVAFMTTLLAGVSVYRKAALNICRETNGTYHVVFNGLDKQTLLSVINMDIFEKTQVYSISSYTSSTDIDFGQMESAGAKMHYLLINDMPSDDTFLRLDAENADLLPPHMRTVTQGRLPEKDGELVISNAAAEMWGFPEIGDSVSAELITCGVKTGTVQPPEGTPMILAEIFDVEDISEISFTVVGYSDEANIVDYNDTRLRSYSYLSDNMVARFSESANDYYWDMHHAFQDAGLEIDDFEYGMNRELLDLEGNGVDAKFSRALFFGVTYLFLIFLMFCARMVIDNSFEISARERIKQFGLLKAVGASKKQVFSLVLWEAVYLAVPGTAAGLILGTVCAGTVFGAVKKLSYLNDISLDYDLASMLEFSPEPYVYISSAAIGVLFVIVSAVSTGMRSIKASPVEAMRSAGKKEKIKPVPLYKGIDKGSSFISAYSSLSVKRNKKRYVITMISMVMSIVMFTVFSYALEIAEGNFRREFEENRQPYDYTAVHAAVTPDDAVNVTENMRSSGYFSEVQYDSAVTVFASAADMDINGSAGENITIYIHPVNEDTFAKHISPENGVSYDELLQSGGILLCADTYSPSGERLDRFFNGVPAVISALPFVEETMDIFDDTVLIGAAGLYSTDSRTYMSGEDGICAVISEENYIQLAERCVRDIYTYVLELDDGSSYNIYRRYINANAAEGMKTEAENYMKMHFYDSFDNNRSDMALSYALLRVIGVLGYFVTGIIALIAVVNIVNIISSNVLGRTSEFAMLRACGMSDKQLKRLILHESMIYTALAGFSALLVTELMIAVIQIPFATHFHDLSFDDLGFTFSYTAPIKYLIPAAAAAFITAAAASFAPAGRIVRSPIVDSVRNTEQY